METYKTSGPVQCHSCQGFGHSSTHCSHQARCVKCGNLHQTKTCSKTPKEPPKCCNYGEAHTANYRKCPIYAAEVAKIQKQRAQVSLSKLTQPPTAPTITLSTSATPSSTSYFSQPRIQGKNHTHQSQTTATNPTQARDLH